MCNTFRVEENQNCKNLRVQNVKLLVYLNKKGDYG